MPGSRNFCQWGGGGGPGPTARKQLGQRSLFSPQLILQFYIGLSIVYLKENYNFPGFQKGVQNFPGLVHHFPGGSNIFQGGLNAILHRNP